VTDHRVLRKPTASPGPRGLDPGEIPLVAFPVGNHPIPHAELERDYGIALAKAIANVRSDPIARNMVGALAEQRLKVSVAMWRGDAPAWWSLSLAREARGDLHGLMEAATTAAELAPDSEVSQTHLATAATAVGNRDLAIAAADAVVRLSPTAIEPLLLRAGIHIRLQDWNKAEADCRSALAIHPLLPQARMLLAICRYHLGDAAGARKEADTAVGLAVKPEQKTALRELFRAQTR
jgi:tetratricopeptide (TPR) repeat protein